MWAVRLLGEKVGGPLGFVGGMVSSTATSMSFARQVRDDPRALHFVGHGDPTGQSGDFVRLAILAALCPGGAGHAVAVLGAALAGGLLATGLGHWRYGSAGGQDEDGFTRTARWKCNRAGVWRPACRGDAGGGGADAPVWLRAVCMAWRWCPG